jgi:hypothetical protein
MKAGKNISILEFNGAGAEPNHIYDCGMTYAAALKVIMRHWEDLYRISRINYKNGVKYWSFGQGFSYLRKAKKYFKQLYRDDLATNLLGNYPGD